jgi:hypothetical protein
MLTFLLRFATTSFTGLFTQKLGFVSFGGAHNCTAAPVYGNIANDPNMATVRGSTFCRSSLFASDGRLFFLEQVATYVVEPDCSVFAHLAHH